MPYLIEDIFDVRNVEKVFDKVSRIFAESESFKMNLILDINSQIYELKKGDKFRMSVTKSILSDAIGGCDEDSDDDAGEETDEKLASSKIAEYDYVVHGKVYRMEASDHSAGDVNRLKVYVSFGGLLMQVTGDTSNLRGFKMGHFCYLLIKKLAF